MKKADVKKILKKIGIIAGILAVVVFVAVMGINIYVMAVTASRIKSIEQMIDMDVNADCIIVLGAAVRPDGTPSKMLEDRLDKTVELYQSGVTEKIIVSGDHREADYDEVNIMKAFLIDKGIPSECIFMDHAGLSTYDTMYRAANIFGVKSAIVVTQRYHMFRALYDASAFDIDAYGVCAKEVRYSGQTYRDLREVAARIKDLGYCIIKPEATVVGDKISLSESGDVTND